MLDSFDDCRRSPRMYVHYILQTPGKPWSLSSFPIFKQPIDQSLSILVIIRPPRRGLQASCLPIYQVPFESSTCLANQMLISVLITLSQNIKSPEFVSLPIPPDSRISLAVMGTFFNLDRMVADGRRTAVSPPTCGQPNTPDRNRNFPNVKSAVAAPKSSTQMAMMNDGSRLRYIGLRCQFFACCRMSVACFVYPLLSFGWCINYTCS